VDLCKITFLTFYFKYYLAENQKHGIYKWKITLHISNIGNTLLFMNENKLFLQTVYAKGTKRNPLSKFRLAILKNYCHVRAVELEGITVPRRP